MSVFALAAKHEMLDALDVDRIQLHTGDPGADGTANVISDTMQAAAWDSAATGKRALTEPVEYTGLTPSQAVTWVSVWKAGEPNVFKGKGEGSGDLAANAEGELNVTQCDLIIND